MRKSLVLAALLSAFLLLGHLFRPERYPLPKRGNIWD